MFVPGKHKSDLGDNLNNSSETPIFVDVVQEKLLGFFSGQY